MEQKADARERSFKEGGIGISIVVDAVTACEYTIKLFCAQASDVLYMQIRSSLGQKTDDSNLPLIRIFYTFTEELFLASPVSSSHSGRIPFCRFSPAAFFPLFCLATFQFLRKLFTTQILYKYNLTRFLHLCSLRGDGYPLRMAQTKVFESPKQNNAPILQI